MKRERKRLYNAIEIICEVVNIDEVIVEIEE